jgi:hypothetical protein
MQVIADFGELCRVICPLCDKGVEVRYRPETNEYVHDQRSKTTFSHSLCLANGLWKKYQEQPGG